MDLLKILRSFEEFLFEAVSWLVFYPLTLWRIVRGPLAAMDYSDREQSDDEAHRYDDALSPPLFLLATIVLTNLLATALHVPPPPEASELSKAVYASQQNLILFRSLAFSLVPLVAAVTLLRHEKKRISRETLRALLCAMLPRRRLRRLRLGGRGHLPAARTAQRRRCGDHDRRRWLVPVRPGALVRQATERLNGQGRRHSGLGRRAGGDLSVRGPDPGRLDLRPQPGSIERTSPEAETVQRERYDPVAIVSSKSPRPRSRTPMGTLEP